MTFNGLKQITYQAILRQKFDSEDKDKRFVNQILAGVLLFKTLQQLMSSSASYQDDIKPTANEYALTFKNISQSLEGKYISYKQIFHKIQSYKLISFLTITDKQIDEVYRLYENKTELREFSMSDFSTRMYNIGNISEKYYTRLSKIHYRIIVPIIEYYKTYYGTQMKEVNTEDIGNTPAHQIKISIDGVDANQIYNDIMRDVMGVQVYISSCNMTTDGAVLLLIK